MGTLIRGLARGSFSAKFEGVRTVARDARILVLLACGAAAACSQHGKLDPPEACPALSEACPANVPSYGNQVAPILERSCGGDSCHSADSSQGAWPLDDYGDVAAWRSVLFNVLDDCSMPPPDDSATLSADERALLAAWLACGTPNN